MSVLPIDTGTPAAPSSALWQTNISVTLELSESRTYDAALETLGAYKLTGNFPTELEIVLRDMRVLDMVNFDIKPKTPLSDCRQVEFRPGKKVRPHSFFEVMRLVKNRIGSSANESLWVRLFQ
jgi:hypothetical protein